MIRNSFALKLNQGMRYRFGQVLYENWTDLTKQLDMHNITNFSMWTAADIVFGYFESNDVIAEWPDEEKEFFVELNKKFDNCYRWISTPWHPMRLMYEDFGIVRMSKELIRHRVFFTKLVPGAEEEYKKRHDGLVEARKGKTNSGPDSNFSIWSAGGYIFGYDEIDTTMEKNRTEADREADIKWETKMLEIMSWITDDVDWITHEHHEHVKRICFHK